MPDEGEELSKEQVAEPYGGIKRNVKPAQEALTASIHSQTNSGPATAEGRPQSTTSSQANAVRVTNEGGGGTVGESRVLKMSDELCDPLKAGRSGRPLTADQGVRTFAPAC